MLNKKINFSNAEERKAFFTETAFGKAIIENCKEWTMLLATKQFAQSCVCDEVFDFANVVFKELFGLELWYYANHTATGRSASLNIIGDGVRYPVMIFDCNREGNAAEYWQM
ncbi:MAG: hypothetical protein MJ168_08200 [Clostridia bacterium]|nr:hypothetical protein [Clostridia bacterium]